MTVKVCDMRAKDVAQIFLMLNKDSVNLKEEPFGVTIVTDIEPDKLLYPEGWYYAKGSLRNKGTSSTGMYEEIPMFRKDGESWADYARYSTR